MPRVLKGEAKYYDLVREWLEKRGYYCGGGMYYGGTEKERWYIRTGIKKLRADIIGLKNVGNEFIDELEILAVEVKEKDKISFRDIQQAYGYSAFAHKVYLATIAKPTEEDKSTATRMGIGLIHIAGKKIEEILSSALMQPNEAEMLKLLNSLWVVKCTICNCYVFKWDTIEDLEGKSYIMFKRARQLDHIKDLARGSPFGDLNKNQLNEKYVIRRYICRTCADEFRLLRGRKRKMK